jgi:hypothetical protein
MKWNVDLAYAGYVSETVEAESEAEAVEKVERMGTAGIGNLYRWTQADMIEEAGGE